MRDVPIGLPLLSRASKWFGWYVLLTDKNKFAKSTQIIFGVFPRDPVDLERIRSFFAC
jgi:hypothetical protein